MQHDKARRKRQLEEYEQKKKAYKAQANDLENEEVEHALKPKDYGNEYEKFQSVWAAFMEQVKHNYKPPTK